MKIWPFIVNLCGANAMKKIHAWLTILWLVAALPIVMFLSDSIPFLVFVSVYAVVVGHWSSWQASRVEVKQVEQEESGD